MAPADRRRRRQQGTLAVQVIDRDSARRRRASTVKTRTGKAVHPDRDDQRRRLRDLRLHPGRQLRDHVTQPGDWVNPTASTTCTSSGTGHRRHDERKTLPYDVAGTLTANFSTHATGTRPGRAWSTARRAAALSVTNGGIQEHRRSASSPRPTRSRQSTTATAKLFPFKDAYGVYSGRCPRRTRRAGGGYARSSTAPGSTRWTSTSPRCALQVMNGADAGDGAPTSWRETPLARDRRRDAGRTGRDQFSGLTTYSAASATSRSGWVTRPAIAGSFDPGLPCGIWDICADESGRASGTGRCRTTVTADRAGPGTTADDRPGERHDGGTCS